MRTRIALLTTSLLFATAGVFAQTKPTAPAPIVTAPPVATAPPSATVGQTITLSGTAYKVSTKKLIATGVEYYGMKATTPKAATTYFLRTNNTYNRTVFTQAQYEAFFKTGKLSSFGALQNTTLAGKTVVYVVKGAKQVMLTTSGKGNILLIDELPDGITVAKLRDEGSAEWYDCRSGCADTYNTCSDATAVRKDPTCTNIPCMCNYVGCATDCDKIPLTQRPILHVLSLKNMSILLN